MQYSDQDRAGTVSIGRKLHEMESAKILECSGSVLCSGAMGEASNDGSNTAQGHQPKRYCARIQTLFFYNENSCWEQARSHIRRAHCVPQKRHLQAQQSAFVDKLLQGLTRLCRRRTTCCQHSRIFAWHDWDIVASKNTKLCRSEVTVYRNAKHHWRRATRKGVTLGDGSKVTLFRPWSTVGSTPNTIAKTTRKNLDQSRHVLTSLSAWENPNQPKQHRNIFQHLKQHNQPKTTKHQTTWNNINNLNLHTKNSTTSNHQKQPRQLQNKLKEFETTTKKQPEQSKKTTWTI